MTRDQIASLAPGDEVHWTDPDAGLCSFTGTIERIEVGETVAFIAFTSGQQLEAFFEELS